MQSGSLTTSHIGSYHLRFQSQLHIATCNIKVPEPQIFSGVVLQFLGHWTYPKVSERTARRDGVCAVQRKLATYILLPLRETGPWNYGMQSNSVVPASTHCRRPTYRHHRRLVQRFCFLQERYGSWSLPSRFLGCRKSRPQLLPSAFSSTFFCRYLNSEYSIRTPKTTADTVRTDFLSLIIEHTCSYILSALLTLFYFCIRNNFESLR
jgi:hypothetical protein